MGPIAVVASGVVSPLGEGEAGTSIGAPGERPRSVVGLDAILAGQGLSRPRAARVAVPPRDGVDRAAWLLERAAVGLVAELDRVLPGWRSRRGALFIGSSGGGMPSLERALALRAEKQPIPPELARAATYAGPLFVLDAVFDPTWPRTHLLAACVSSTVAIGLGCRALDRGDVDLVIAGGYDALSSFIASGFEALGATTASEPRPFRATRDGMALGEGAALVALARAADVAPVLGTVLGFGTTSDAVHVTAPDPAGKGLIRAAEAALSDAGLRADAVDLVSAHATATPHNDGAETAALAAILGRDAERVVVHPYKAVVGHTLGAAGAIEMLAALTAMRRGVLPAALGAGAPEPDFACRLLEANESGTVRHAIKLSSAFGGSNAALVLGPPAVGAGVRPRAPVSPGRSVRVAHEGAHVAEPDRALMTRRTRLDEIRVERLDRASALAVTAVARVLEAEPAFAAAPERVAIIVATEVGSLEQNELFDSRRREQGARGVEPRRFPATSPNLPAGVCSIAFGLLGPSFAVGGGPGAAEGALLVARLLLTASNADVVIVVVVDDVGSVARDLLRAGSVPDPVDGARAIVLVSP